MRFARIVFAIAGVWGIVVLIPLYFAVESLEPRYAAAIAHPEWYYGFIAVALAWQAAFLVIARNPVRYRPIMLPAMLEKFGYVATLAVLYMQGRLNASQLAIGSPDLI